MKKCSDNSGIIAGVIISCTKKNLNGNTAIQDLMEDIADGNAVFLETKDVADASIAPVSYSRIDGTTVDTQKGKWGVTLTTDASDKIKAKFSQVVSGDYFAFLVYRNINGQYTVKSHANGNMFNVTLSGNTFTEAGLTANGVQSLTVIFGDYNPSCIKWTEIPEIPTVNVICAVPYTPTPDTATSIMRVLSCAGLPIAPDATTLSYFTAESDNVKITTLTLAYANDVTKLICGKTAGAGEAMISITDSTAVDYFEPFTISWSV